MKDNTSLCFVFTVYRFDHNNSLKIHFGSYKVNILSTLESCTENIGILIKKTLLETSANYCKSLYSNYEAYSCVTSLKAGIEP